MLKLYKINISVEAALETILQDFTLALCFIFLLQRYKESGKIPNILS